ncbi:hypothetical protein ACFQ1S_34600, partial [Kibdelosporangium lantanae]
GEPCPVGRGGSDVQGARQKGAIVKYMIMLMSTQMRVPVAASQVGPSPREAVDSIAISGVVVTVADRVTRGHRDKDQGFS